MEERRRREEQLRRAEEAAAEIFYRQGKQAKEKKESPDAVVEGTRICVAGRGRGTCLGCQHHFFHANEHTIRFDSGETAVLRLKEEEWAVNPREMDRMDPPRPLALTVATITGRLTELNVWSTHTIGAVKDAIQKEAGIPADKQALIFRNQPQDDSATLQQAGVEDGATIHLVMQGDALPSPESEPSDIASPGMVRLLSAQARQDTVIAREAERVAQAEAEEAAAELGEAQRQIAELRRAERWRDDGNAGLN